MYLTEAQQYEKIIVWWNGCTIGILLGMMIGFLINKRVNQGRHNLD